MSPEYLAGFFDGEGCIDCQYMYPQQARNVFTCDRDYALRWLK